MKYVSKAVCLISFIVSCALFGLYCNRKQLPYNSEGRYFDEESATVYHQQVVEASLLLAILFTLIFAVSLLVEVKSRRHIAGENTQQSQNPTSAIRHPK